MPPPRPLLLTVCGGALVVAALTVGRLGTLVPLAVAVVVAALIASAILLRRGEARTRVEAAAALLVLAAALAVIVQLALFLGTCFNFWSAGHC